MMEAARRDLDLEKLFLLAGSAAVEAAEKTGDRHRAEHYRELRDAERRRIDS
ncbi:hypothetical protein [Winogradskya humida]|uniref:Uncharacterized protein n=1 Tax=Winogradskya humida TaxID=113566 RepID=A0ABQ3ZZR4_9ACTN|nr:hypothetical protein [Actinoplanes humidus]GIE24110.1 hypothetical protein Ahu01nite_072120 [Actinoplanes humidus]